MVQKSPPYVGYGVKQLKFSRQQAIFVFSLHSSVFYPATLGTLSLGSRHSSSQNCDVASKLKKQHGINF
jgi:hypothetical protein